MLELEGVRKVFHGPAGDVVALDDVSLRVEPGEIVAVEGRSGSGKTTLLLVCGGLLAPDAGSVRLGGDALYALDAAARARLRSERVGFVFQQFHLIPYLSALENILAPTLARPIRDARNRAIELARRFGIEERLAHVPAELSVGERQRTAMARALLPGPGLILADEPTGNLDRDSAGAILRHLEEFAGEGGAVLLVTHDAAASAHAHRRLRIEAGGLRPVSA